jgi:NADH:ubiquinone oxidoreductase subunit F (NADH-binding)/Pyruvate/2-oxoacid:ferredoxin oxidoreductase delta subunit/(2Fe-2S) ferredoxin
VMSLLEPCCAKCTHTAETPCKDYVACKTAGPLCHDDAKCRAKIKAANDLTLNGGGLVVKIGMSTCGLAAGSQAVYDALAEQLAGKAELVKVGCMGHCYAEPLVEITAKGGTPALYGNVKPVDVPKMLASYMSGDASGALAVRDRRGTLNGEEKTPLFTELPFNKGQRREVLANCGVINPDRIEDYIARGGYRALSKVLNGMTPEQVIDHVKSSGLRGRGGAGFPAGMKWQLCRAAPGAEKYMICNADEGDPGAFMNRLTAEGDPHRVLEGLIIAAYAIGASKGYVFVRAEKPLMAKRLMGAVEQARKAGLLGKNILGSGYSLDIEVILSAGAFVCGEETALIAAIEGKRAMPRPRPPFPATNGLWGKPTTINNVETLAHVPNVILDKDHFASVGSEKSKGTKVFCLAGKVERTGAAEVPLGTSLRHLIFEIGGGVADGKAFKAVQTGGPSGGCLSEKFLDLSLDYESLQSAGSIMGSGGIIVMDEDTCVVDTAKYFLGFTTAESCGKCTPCRIGLKRVHGILTRITEGKGTVEDLSMLESLGATIGNTALCALGQGAPNPVLTTLRYFPLEYMAHIKEKECPAHVCASLTKFYVDKSNCVGCGLCAKSCPVEAITMQEAADEHEAALLNVASIDSDRCIRCGSCATVCPKKAIRRV